MKRRDLLAASTAGSIGALMLNTESASALPGTDESATQGFKFAEEIKTHDFGESIGANDPAVKVLKTLFANDDKVAGAYATYVPWYNDREGNRVTTSSGDEAAGYYRLFDADGNGWQIDGILNPKQGGAKGDGSTNDAEAFKDLFKVAVKNRLIIELDGATYRCTEPLYLDGVSQNFENFSIYLNGNNSTIYFDLQQAESYCFRVNGENIGGQALVLRNLHIVGPGRGDASFDPDSVNGSYANKAIGLDLKNFINVELDNVSVSLCWIGMKTQYVFPITAHQVRLEANYINLYLHDDTTSATWTRCRFLNGRYSMILKPSAYGAVYGQQFIGCHLEECVHGAILDPNDIYDPEKANGIWGIHFIGCYTEGIGFKDSGQPRIGHILRIGRSIGNPETDDLNASEFGNNRERKIFNIIYYPSVESLPEDPGPGNELRIFFNSNPNTVKDVELLHTRFNQNAIEHWYNVENLTLIPGGTRSFSDTAIPMLPGQNLLSFYTHPSDTEGKTIDLSVNTGRIQHVKKLADPGKYRVTMIRSGGTRFDYSIQATLDRLGLVSASPDVEYFDVTVYDHQGNAGAIAARVFLKIDVPV